MRFAAGKHYRTVSLPRLATISIALWPFFVAGCGTLGTRSAGSSRPANPTDGNQDVAQSDALGLKSGEPNDSFDSAIPALLENHRGELQGTVTGSGDIDVFDLGPVNAGDRFLIDVETFGSGLDVSIALFDEEGRLFIDNDDGSSNDLDSSIDEIVRHGGNPYYLAVTHSFFAASTSAREGGYWVTITIRPDGDVPRPEGQAVFLDFDGGTVNDPNIESINYYGDQVPPFSGSSIARRYTEFTTVIKDGIVATIEENFAGFDVTLFTSDEGGLPTGAYSTILFGGYSTTAFGISQSVDHYNVDLSDLAVIFTESFTPAVFLSDPDAEELGRAIGNVASHEIGHLLGLNHVVNQFDLMDTNYPPDTFVNDQDFRESPLSEQIMELGTQDALLMLAEILGIV